MTRFFFDVMDATASHYDFQGVVLHDVEQARRRAELVALDLCCRDAEASSVDVRDVHGRTILSVVLPPEERADA